MEAEDWLVKYHWKTWQYDFGQFVSKEEIEAHATTLGWEPKIINMTLERKMTPVQARQKRIKATNEVNVIYPYRTRQGTWVYDDEDLGVYKEAFVMGSGEVIDHLVGKDCNIFQAAISKNPIPGYDAKLINIDHISDEGNEETIPMQGWYQLEGTNMQHWLCGCVLDYFEGYPNNIYVKITK